MLIVAPYKPIPESELSRRHRTETIGDFDWIDAIKMLSASAERFGYTTLALSDTELPVPHIRLNTQHSNLMLWILEVSIAFLESEHFNQDTAFISPDTLVNKPLPEISGYDLGLCVRLGQKYAHKPLLNGVQLWSIGARKRLIAFYRRCLEMAEAGDTRWGADTWPMVRLLSPMSGGLVKRAGLKVRMFGRHEMMRSIGKGEGPAIAAGGKPKARGTILIDFKGDRKRYMRDYFKATYENS